jgi:hypothetical protein
VARQNPHRYEQVGWLVAAQFALATLCFSTWLSPLGFTLLPDEILVRGLPFCLVPATVAGLVLIIRHRRGDWLIWGTAIAAIAMVLSVAMLLIALSLDGSMFQG